MNKFIDNLIDLELLGTLIEDNLVDKHNQIKLRVLNERQQVIYIVNAICRAGFMSFPNTFIVQLYKFTYI